MGRGRKREKKGRERRKEEREEILVQRSQLADYTPKFSCTATLGSGCGLREWVWFITGCIHFTSSYDDKGNAEAVLVDSLVVQEVGVV